MPTSTHLDAPVFGVGLSRTGSHSLCRALGMLGRLCVHNPSASLMVAGRFDDALGPFDSACDSSCAAFYAQLAEAYPRGKFICTVRGDGPAWERSCVAHFASRRCDDDGDASPRGAVRTALYGSANPSTADLRRARARHAAEIVAHFAAHGRASDLLLIDITAPELRPRSSSSGIGGVADARWLRLWRFITGLPAGAAALAETLPPRVQCGCASFPHVTDATQRDARAPLALLRIGSDGGEPLFITAGHAHVCVRSRKLRSAAATATRGQRCRRFCILWVQRGSSGDARLEIYRSPHHACGGEDAALEGVVGLVVDGQSLGCSAALEEDGGDGGDRAGGALAVRIECVEQRWVNAERCRARRGDATSAMRGVCPATGGGVEAGVASAARRAVMLHLDTPDAARAWQRALRRALSPCAKAGQRA